MTSTGPVYDLITIGGGLAGAALAYAMAKSGAKVLVIEREARFRDRVRGELMSPWGLAEARALGIERFFLEAGAKEINTWSMDFGGMKNARDLPTTTRPGVGTMSFYHPAAQEALLAAAASAGAEVRRGVGARGVVPGKEPGVILESIEGGGGKEAGGNEAGGGGKEAGSGRKEVGSTDGSGEMIRARLVVGADGRTSAVRRWMGFPVQTDAPRLRIAGVLLGASSAPKDAVSVNVIPGRLTLMCPQKSGDVRAYFAFHRDAYDGSFSGAGDLERFIQESVNTGANAAWFQGVEQKGPLATFEGADTWTDAPYRDGIALIGDAAAASDPSWGQGVSLTLRDVRTLRDRLLETRDWDAAGRAYAADHDRYYKTLHTMEDWTTDLLMAVGPEADARRGVAFAAAMADPSRSPDVLHSGPDMLLDDDARRRFFGL